MAREPYESTGAETLLEVNSTQTRGYSTIRQTCYQVAGLSCRFEDKGLQKLHTEVTGYEPMTNNRKRGQGSSGAAAPAAKAEEEELTNYWGRFAKFRVEVNYKRMQKFFTYEFIFYHLQPWPLRETFEQYL
jgi:hypothetical protein